MAPSKAGCLLLPASHSYIITISDLPCFGRSRLVVPQQISVHLLCITAIVQAWEATRVTCGTGAMRTPAPRRLQICALLRLLALSRPERGLTACVSRRCSAQT